VSPVHLAGEHPLDRRVVDPGSNGQPSQAQGGSPMGSIVFVVIIVLIVLFVLGYFGRGRIRR
jgi:hypothetical protein